MAEGNKPYASTFLSVSGNALSVRKCTVYLSCCQAEEPVPLIIATRGDLPFSLARQYVSVQVTELHADVLRFTAEDMHTLLALAIPSLTPDEIASLEQSTEGWAAGLQLAILALQEHHASTHSVAAFAANNRYLQRYAIESASEKLTKQY